MYYFNVGVLLTVCALGSANSPSLSACTCEDHLFSSKITCVQIPTDAGFTVTEDICKGRISIAEVRLTTDTQLSPEWVPSVKTYRLDVIGNGNLDGMQRDALNGHEDSLQFLQIIGGKLDLVPSSIADLNQLESLGVTEHHIQTIFCYSLRYNPTLKQLMLMDNEISTIERCSFPMTLTALSLKNNKITTLNGSLVNHGKLEKLFIQRNRLTSLNGELNGLNSLAVLDASWNIIEEINTIPITLPDLMIMNMSHNRISDLGNSLGGFRNLRSLDLSYNDLVALGNRTFINLNELRYLSLAANSLRQLKDNVFEHLTALKSLIISKNVIRNLDGKLRGLKSLTKLDVSYNHIRTVGYPFEDLTELEELNLSENRIDELSNSFNYLRKLKRLYLNSNFIRELKIGVFSQLRNLEVLSLSFNEIRNLDGAVFIPLPVLSVLDLSLNKITDLEALVKPCLMGYQPLLSEGTTERKCNCIHSRMRQLRLGGNTMICYYGNFQQTKALLEEQDIEMITGC